MARRRRTPGDYEVGYGRPPVASRFKPGQSGNPKGRPKTSKNVDTILQDTFFRKVTVREGGVARSVPFLEAFLMFTAKTALGGDGPAANRIIRLLPLAMQVMRPLGERDDGDPETVTALGRTDREVLRHFAGLVRAGEISFDEETAE